MYVFIYLIQTPYIIIMSVWEAICGRDIHFKIKS